MPANVEELSGVDLARAVAEAVGFKMLTDATESLLRSVDGMLYPWRPQLSADDALVALEVMNARGWRVWHPEQYADCWKVPLIRPKAFKHGRTSYEEILGEPVLEVSALGDSFAEALSRAIVAAKESEGK